MIIYFYDYYYYYSVYIYIYIYIYIYTSFGLRSLSGEKFSEKNAFVLERLKKFFLFFLVLFFFMGVDIL